MEKFVKSINIFQSYDHKCIATFLRFTVYVAELNSLSSGCVFTASINLCFPFSYKLTFYLTVKSRNKNFYFLINFSSFVVFVTLTNL